MRSSVYDDKINIGRPIFKLADAGPGDMHAPNIPEWARRNSRGGPGGLEIGHGLRRQVMRITSRRSRNCTRPLAEST